LQRDSVNSENLAVNTKFGASIIFKIRKEEYICIAIAIVTYKLYPKVDMIYLSV